MNLQEVVEVRNCPACGHKNKPETMECAYCGADISRVPLVKELQTMQVVQDAANRPPPPPPSREQVQKAAASALLGSRLAAARGWLMAIVVGAGAVFLLYAVSSKEPSRTAAPAAEEASGPDPLNTFYAWKLRSGEDKGKTMRQFWSEYVQVYEMSRSAGRPGMEVKVLAQRSPSAQGLHDVFVFESVPGERRRAFPFSVNAATGDVAPGRNCDFGQEIPAEYSVASCESVSELFPEGL
jgi:hypothetical protein